MQVIFGGPKHSSDRMILTKNKSGRGVKSEEDW